MDELRALFSPSCDKDKAMEKCKILAESYSDAVELESYSVSDLSPGIVDDSETIARQVFSPIHIDREDNSIKPTAFDDVSNKGLSVNRLLHTNENNIHAAGHQKASNDNSKYIENGSPLKANRAYLGYVSASVIDIRRFLDEEHRVFTVYDSSLSEALEHADVCMIKHDTNNPKGAKWVKMFRRRKLQEMFTPLIQPNPL